MRRLEAKRNDGKNIKKIEEEKKKETKKQETNKTQKFKWCKREKKLNWMRRLKTKKNNEKNIKEKI